MRISRLFAISAVFALIAGAGQAHAAPACNRACMQQVLDKYIDALGRRDPGAVRLAKVHRVTENVAVVKFGEGLWRKAGPATYRSEAVDPVTGQAAAMLVMPEDNRPVIVFLRLKVVGRAIAEAETLIVRQGEGQRSATDSLVGRSAVYETPVAPAQRMSRKALIAAADAYLDGLHTSGTPQFVAPPLADDAARIENGISTSGPRPGMPPRTIVESMRQGFGQPGKRATLEITDRRHPVADEERGVAVVIGKMNLDLPPDTPDMPGLHATNTQHRKQILVEFFKAYGGKVRLIQAVMYDLDDPVLQTTGWVK